MLGLTAKEIQNGISKFELTKKRMDIRVLKNGATLIMIVIMQAMNQWKQVWNIFQTVRI